MKVDVAVAYAVNDGSSAVLAGFEVFSEVVLSADDAMGIDFRSEYRYRGRLPSVCDAAG